MRYIFRLFSVVMLLAPLAFARTVDARPTAPPNQQRPYRVAILQDDIATLDSQCLQQVSRVLTKSGMAVTPITAEQMAGSQAFNSDKFDCLALIDSPHFPVIAERGLLKFIGAGGDLVLMGGRAFAEPLWKQSDHWLTRDAVQALPANAPRPEGFSPNKEIAFYAAFDDYEVYCLHDVTAIASATQQKWFPQPLAWTGRFEGLSAIGFGLHKESTFIPLLSALDRHQRVRGWAGGILVNYAGPYKHSQWALFGITTPAFYRSQQFTRVLVEVLHRFRGHELESWAAAEYKKSAECIVAAPSAPPSPLHIDKAAHVFARPDGRPQFLVGCNYIGGLHGKYSAEDAGEVEADFQRMQRAGINAVRIYSMKRFLDPRGAALLKSCARKYGVYFMPVVIDHPDRGSKGELQTQARQMAALFKGEPMLLGYDLTNEPYFWEVGKIKTDQGQTLGSLNPSPQNGWKLYEQRVGMKLTGAGFPELHGKLPYPSDSQARQAFDSVNAIYGTFIGWLRTAIRQVDADVPITVGYNTVWACMPANEPLEFMASHFYRLPEDADSVRRNMGALDSLRAVWPGRPIFAGEFGYSGGNVIHGRLLDVNSIAVGELAHYLYTHAHGYAGMFKWSLTDFSRWEDWRQVRWFPWADREKHVKEARFGLYYDDGTPQGKAKPLAGGLRFLRDYVDAGGKPGTLEIVPADTAIGAGYLYRAPNALFVGNRRYHSDKLSVDAPVPANVMLWWDDRELRVLSTADAVLRLRPADFVAGLSADPARLRGVCGKVSVEAECLVVEILAGQRVTLH